jgi:ribose/xylose/arabinose/galactoside ABC-type transport system permease subunit/ABC-type multidrug transport system ATPase subunit
MVGREVQESRVTDFAGDPQAVMLEVRDVSDDMLKGIDFQVRRGEILGFSGLVGAGRTELMEAIFGIRKPRTGEVLIEGWPVTIRSAIDAIKANLGFVTEDRKETGLVLCRDIGENSNYVFWQKGRGFFKQRAVSAANAKRMIDRLGIRCSSPRQLVSNLSGGNQQKVALAKWLLSGARILVLDEPTRGVDVGARQELYRIIKELAAEGVAIVIVSSDLPEILTICERVIVMHEGKITGELKSSELSETRSCTSRPTFRRESDMEAEEKRADSRLLQMVKNIWRNYSIVLMFVAILIICGIFAPRFLRPQNLLNILRNTSIVGSIALGMTFVIIAGGIDLSSGPVLATSGAVLIFLQRMVNPDGSPMVPLPLAILACCAVAVAFGLLNGVVITKAKLPPFIVTLAVGIIARSITMYVCRGATIMGNNIPQFTQIGSGSLLGIPIPFIVVIVMAVLFHIFLTRTKYGTYVFAVGGNENAARYSGIKVDRVRIITYMLVGLCRDRRHRRRCPVAAPRPPRAASTSSRPSRPSSSAAQPSPADGAGWSAPLSVSLSWESSTT